MIELRIKDSQIWWKQAKKNKKILSHHQHNNDELSSNLNEIKKSQKQSIDPSTITHKTQDLNIKRKYVHR
jgi:hypothetical protein